MVTVIVGAVAPTLFGTTVGGLVATAAAGLAAAYIDSAFIMPALFGKDGPRPEDLTGLDLMTSQLGAPRNYAMGREAVVPGHVLWIYGIRRQSVGGGGGKGSKGGGGSVDTVRADVGIAWNDGLIRGVALIYADNELLWASEMDRENVTDYRFTVTVLAGGNLRLTAASTNDQDFADIFTSARTDPVTNTTRGDIVRIERMTPATALGLWRVVSIARHGSAPSTMDLTPLQGQSLTAGSTVTPGSRWDPAVLRRMRLTLFSDHTPTVERADTFYANTGSGTNNPGLLACNRHLGAIFPVPSVLRITGLSSVNGLYRLIESSVTGAPAAARYCLLAPMEGQTLPASGITAGTATNAMVVEWQTLNSNNFQTLDNQQGLLPYFGLPDEVADPTLAQYVPAGQSMAYRNVARSTWTAAFLYPHGNRIPQLTGVLVVNGTETNATAVAKILRRVLAPERFSVDDVTPAPLWGYNVIGTQPTKTALQPLLSMYGIEAQDRGGVLAFFTADRADLHQLAVGELGARAADTQERVATFAHRRLQDVIMPKRVTLDYIDPRRDHQKGSSSAGIRNPSKNGADETRDHVVMNLQPIVSYPWEADVRAEQVMQEVRAARDQGTLTLMPSRMDVLEGDRVTFTALNERQEVVTPDGSGSISHQSAMRPMAPGTVALEVMFETSGSARLVDKGSSLIGFPATVSTTTNTVNVATGAITLDASEKILWARLTYRYDHSWRMRVQRVARQRNRLLKLELVGVNERFRILGSPYSSSEPPPPILTTPAQIAVHVLDIAAPHRAQLQSPGIFFGACALPGARWAGCNVQISLDGGANYTTILTISEQTTQGVATTALAAGTVNVQDWANSVTVRLQCGTLTSTTWEMLSTGVNWALVGNEILGFQTATLNGDGTYTLTGLVRGIRNTEDQTGTHAIGERFVLLTGIGFYGGFHQFADWTWRGRAVKFRFLAAGALTESGTVVDHTILTANVRPFSPVALGSTAEGTDHVFRWERRTRDIVPLVGPGSMGPLLEPYERYRLEIRRNGAFLKNYFIGGPSTGSPFVQRLFRYTSAMRTADGFAGGDTLVARAYQVGQGGDSKAASDMTVTL